MRSISLADLPMRELTALICSNSVAPGAGAAGALTLALAAACGAKAVSISLKHSEDARLHVSLDRFQELSRCALAEADDDARAFSAWVRDRGVRSTDELIESEERMAQLISALLATIGEVEPFVRPNMVGDLVAAKSLASAARTIQVTNEAEAKIRRGRAGGA
jgi:formiminotetrahydrofolate cyclodeaminase